MNCSVVVLNVAHNIYSPSQSCSNINANTNIFSNNLMVKFQQLESPISTTNHNVISREIPPLMKRRRPEKISIPVSKLSNLVDDIIGAKSTSDRVDVIEVEGDGYGVYCKRGKSRAHLEDRYSAIVNNVHAHTKQAFFGIFDGHGGAKAAEFAASKLGNKILDNVGKNCNNKLIIMEEKIRDGFLDLDQEFLSENLSGGTCCVTAFIEDGTLVVSNVGDCRGIISRGGIAEALTTDHTPGREDEKKRIETKGGYVDKCNGVWRVQGSLAVSRAIGDRHMKQWIIAEPDTKIINIKPSYDFLILASDGLWNKVTNQEAVDVITPFCKVGDHKTELAHACRKLAELSINRGSNDDTSVMVIRLGQFAPYMS